MLGTGSGPRPTAAAPSHILDGSEDRATLAPAWRVVGREGSGISLGFPDKGMKPQVLCAPQAIIIGDSLSVRGNEMRPASVGLVAEICAVGRAVKVWFSTSPFSGPSPVTDAASGVHMFFDASRHHQKLDGED